MVLDGEERLAASPCTRSRTRRRAGAASSRRSSASNEREAAERGVAGRARLRERADGADPPRHARLGGDRGGCASGRRPLLAQAPAPVGAPRRFDDARATSADGVAEPRRPRRRVPQLALRRLAAGLPASSRDGQRATPSSARTRYHGIDDGRAGRLVGGSKGLLRRAVSAAARPSALIASPGARGAPPLRSRRLRARRRTRSASSGKPLAGTLELPTPTAWRFTLGDMDFF